MLSPACSRPRSAGLAVAGPRMPVASTAGSSSQYHNINRLIIATDNSNEFDDPLVSSANLLLLRYCDGESAIDATGRLPRPHRPAMASMGRTLSVRYAGKHAAKLHVEYRSGRIPKIESLINDRLAI